jgi:FAD/FMN-containing dehydrogenase
LLARAHSLTIDRLVAARVVLADGSVVVAYEHENRELFWAVRGAGANFGVAVSFDFVVDEVDRVGLALLTHSVEDPASFLVTFGETASSAPRETTAVLLAGPADRVLSFRRRPSSWTPRTTRRSPPASSPSSSLRRSCSTRSSSRPTPD